MAFFALSVNILKYAYLAIMAMFGQTNESSTMHLFFMVIGLVCILIYVYQGLVKSKLTKNEVYLLIFIVCFFGLFMFTGPNKYGYTSEVFKGMYLTFGSASIPAFLMGILIRKKGNIAEIGKWIPIFILLMTVSGFMVALNPSGTTGGGYLEDDSGFGYQTLSYTAAYAFGMTFYYIKYYDNLPKFHLFTDPLWKKIFSVFMIIQAVTVLLAGGRGGFLVLGVFAIYYMYINSESFGTFINRIILLAIAFLVILGIVNMLNISTSGVDRILNSLLTGEEGSEREMLRETAKAFGMEKPVFGQGIGCVFYVMGWYSHNLFTDVFCEMGFVGLAALVTILIFFAIRIVKLIKENPLNHIVLIFFLSGFLMLMFSNYYAAVPFVWFACGYAFLNDTPRKEKQKNEIYLP